MMWLRLATAMLFAGVASAAYASTQGVYVSTQGGFSYLPNLQIGGSTVSATDSFKAGHVLGTALGYDDGNGWRYELDLIHQLSAVDRFNGLPESGRLWSMGLMANVMYDLTQGTRLTPYVGAGAGVQWIGGSVHGYSGKSWRPAYQVRTGVRFDLAPKSALFVEYRFSQSQAVKLSNAATTAHHDFAEHAIMVGITFRTGIGALESSGRLVHYLGLDTDDSDGAI